MAYLYLVVAAGTYLGFVASDEGKGVGRALALFILAVIWPATLAGMLAYVLSKKIDQEVGVAARDAQINAKP